MAWVNEGIIVQLAPPTATSGVESQLWHIPPEGKNFEQLQLASVEGCFQQSYEAPRRLADGRVAYIIRCVPPNLMDTQLFMYAYSFASGQSLPLLETPLPWRYVGTGGYSWNSSITEGITSGGGRISGEQLFRFTPSSVERIDTDLPSAFAASRSPDDKQIIFLGTESTRRGVSILDASFNLYLMDSNTLSFETLVTSLYNPSPPIWSPDGQWIALNATTGALFRQENLWFINVVTSEKISVPTNSVVPRVWSLDGREVLALQRIGANEDNKTQIVRINVERVLSTISK